MEQESRDPLQDVTRRDVSQSDSPAVKATAGDNVSDGRRPWPPNPATAVVDENDMLALRFLEFVHRTLLFCMKLLKNYGRYAYSTT